MHDVVDTDTLIVGWTSAGLTWDLVEVKESTTSVWITIRLYTAPLPGADFGVQSERVIDLSAPLGNRQVVGGSTGAVALQTRCEFPLFQAPGCVVEEDTP